MISVTNAKYIGLRRVTAISKHSVRVQTHTSHYAMCGAPLGLPGPPSITLSALSRDT
jgi:hypothetical protein